MTDYWNTIYCIVNYESGQIAFIDQYIDVDGNKTDNYGFWITYGNDIQEITDPEKYFIEHYEEGYGESMCTLAECFEKITNG